MSSDGIKTPRARGERVDFRCFMWVYFLGSILVELVGLVIFVFEGKYGHLAKRSVERENGGQIKRVKGKLGYRVKRKW